MLNEDMLPDLDVGVEQEGPKKKPKPMGEAAMARYLAQNAERKLDHDQETPGQRYQADPSDLEAMRDMDVRDKMAAHGSSEAGHDGGEWSKTEFSKYNALGAKLAQHNASKIKPGPNVPAAQRDATAVARKR